MAGEMIARIGPLATWVLILGVLPAVALVGAMWSIDRFVDRSTARALDAARPSGPDREQ